MQAMKIAGINQEQSGGNRESICGITTDISLQLGAWVADLSFDDIPDEVLHIARRCVTDTIAVSVAGARAQISQSMHAHALSYYGSGDCTLFAGVDGLSMPGACLANGVAAHALDFDDTSYAGIVHGSAIVLPAVLAVAEHGDISGADFLTAFVAGSEVIYALGLTLGDHHYLNGWWATSTLGAIGAAAGAAKALGHGPQKTSMAIALAGVQANGMSAIFGFDAKPIVAGQAARLGIEAALLADRSIGAPLSVFEDPRGFLKLMNDGIANRVGLDDLGETWRLLNPGIAIKRAPVCSAAQAAIEAVQQLIALNDLAPAQIKTVRCDVPHLVKISLVHEQPTTAAQAQFSMPFAIGCILAFGELGPAQISMDALASQPLQEAMGKVVMVVDAELDGSKFQPQFPECARVTLTMNDGQRFTHFIGAATGMPGNPLSDEALKDKLMTCTAYAGWSDKMANDLFKKLQNIDELSSMRALMQGVS